MGLLDLFMVWVLLTTDCVNALKLTVKTNYVQILSKGVTFECDLEGATWDINTTPRLWRIPPSATAVIVSGNANPGYSEDLSDASTLGIIRMTTPELDWNVENGNFQCAYEFNTAELNATRGILLYLSPQTSDNDKEDPSDSCSLEWRSVLPRPSLKEVLITHVKGNQENLTVSDVRVTESVSNNSNTEDTFKYTLSVKKEGLDPEDNITIVVEVGPRTETKTCIIEGTNTTTQITSTGTNLSTTETSTNSSTQPDELKSNSTIHETELSSSVSVDTAEPSTMSSSPTATVTSHPTEASGLSDELIIGVSVASLAGFILIIVIIVFLCLYLRKRSKSKSGKMAKQKGNLNNTEKKDYLEPARYPFYINISKPKTRVVQSHISSTDNREIDAYYSRRKVRSLPRSPYDNNAWYQRPTYYTTGGTHHGYYMELPNPYTHYYSAPNYYPAQPSDKTSTGRTRDHSTNQPNEYYHGRNYPNHGKLNDHLRGNHHYSQSIADMDNRQYEMNWMY